MEKLSESKNSESVQDSLRETLCEKSYFIPVNTELLQKAKEYVNSSTNSESSTSSEKVDTTKAKNVKRGTVKEADLFLLSKCCLGIGMWCAKKRAETFERNKDTRKDQLTDLYLNEKDLILERFKFQNKIKIDPRYENYKNPNQSEVPDGPIDNVGNNRHAASFFSPTALL